MAEKQMEEPLQSLDKDQAGTSDHSTKEESNKDEAKEKPPLASVWETLSFARTRKTNLQMVGAFCFAVLSGFTFPVMVFYFSKAFEDLSRSTDDDDFMDTIRSMVYGFLVLGFVILASMTTQNFLAESAAETMSHNLKTDWFRALLRQDMAYYDICDVGGESTIISSNGNRYHLGVGRKLAESVQYTVTFSGSFAFAFYSSWETSLVVLSVCPLLILSVYFLLKMNNSQTARANATYARAGSIVNTSITAIRTILSLNAAERIIDEYKQATQEAYDGAVGHVWLVGLAYGSQFGSFILSYVVVTLFGTWLLYDNVVDTGCDPSGTVDDNDSCDPKGLDVFGALMGISFGAAVLPQVTVCMEKFIGAREACFPALRVINRSTSGNEEKENSQNYPSSALTTFHRGGSILPPYVIDSSSETGKRPDSVSGDIVFDKVTFAYPTRKENLVFQDFSLNIPGGKTVALVGSSGCGKSSVVNLVERFYDVDSGLITLDGEDLRDLNIKWLRQQIGLVSQEPKLFAMTIRENIIAGAPEATMDEVIEAAKSANAHDFISQFPAGYETQVGDLGGQLSGGQKQRIAIARILLKKPKVLILDEATSALDSESEKSVQQALDEILKTQKVTTIVIAHRLSTIRSADLIAVVDHGKVAEAGTHSELLSLKGLYFKMVEAQMGRANSSDYETGSNVTTPCTTEHGSTDDKDSEDFESGGSNVIEFHKVGFAYPARPDSEIFHNLNLTVRRGETLALCGPSGGGKSTVIQLIENFYRPSSGYITFKGDDMSNLNVRWLRDQFGLVTQEPVLFDTTIEENIRYGCPNATHEQVVEAAKSANAHDFITEFPLGYETRVGQGSSLISGGQKQRIAIARALLKRPTVLLLDEATSALDSKSEKIVQEALDKIMFSSDQTCVVVAHRLSTIRNADRIAVIEKGHVTEIGTHDELMSKPGGRYQKLQALQDLTLDTEVEEIDDDAKPSKKQKGEKGDGSEKEEKVDEEVEIGQEEAKQLALKASLFGKGDSLYFAIGGVGALLTGLMFPSWGFIFAYMTEIVFYPVLPCPSDEVQIDNIEDCPMYWESVKDFMKDRSFDIFYGFIAVIASSLIGYVLLFTGFGFAQERMNKRTRDAAFRSLIRQEVGWFDVRSKASLTSRLSDDAALLRAFSGEPIRTLIMNIASTLVGVIVAFIYMWPFALLTIGLLPFMAFGAEMEMRTYLGEDEGDADQIDEHSPGGIVIETLSDIRTVASLTLEESRAIEFADALSKEDPHPIRNKIVKGGGSGLGQFTQMWGFGLMFFWGGWLLNEYSDEFSYRDYLIAMFAFMFSLYGLAAAFEGTADREKAKAAAARIFELIDRKSLIDPLSDEGRKDV